MAIMIPEKPIDIPIGSHEDEMFIALSKLPDEYYVFHSFVIINNVNGVQYESETDFIVFNPQKGIICIEAKAGQVKCESGKWMYGSGIEMSHGGPYRKADSDKWKLQKYFQRKGLQNLWDKCKVLHAVWFPSITRAYLNMIQMPSDGDKSITLTKESLTNIKEDIDKIRGLGLGADDYIPKPFNPLELIARVKAQLRRYTQYNDGSRNAGEIIDFGGLVLNKASHECVYNERQLTLTPLEFDILWLLCENRGKVISSEELFRQVWKEEYFKNSNNTVMVHIRHLREKMSGPTGKSDFIKTVWGVGYKVEE